MSDSDANLEICLDKKRNINLTLFQDFVRIWTISKYETDIRSYSVSRNGLYVLIEGMQEVEQMFKWKKSGSRHLIPEYFFDKDNVISLIPHFEKMREDETCSSEIYLGPCLNLTFIVTETKKERICLHFDEEDVIKFIKAFYYIDSIWHKYERA